tara:strand:- start:2300 stop:4075 length:1776 start_codon:yes stop_codon:yes gene_type:complete
MLKKDLTILFSNSWSIIKNKRKKDFIIAQILFILSGISEIIFLSTLSPFIANIINNDGFWEIENIRTKIELVGIRNQEQFSSLLFLLLVLSIILNLFLKLLSLKTGLQLTKNLGNDISSEIYYKCLNQPYSKQIARNSSELISGILGKVNSFMTAISLFFQMIRSIFLTLIVIVPLFLLNPKISLFLLLLASILYSSFILSSKRKLKNNAKLISKEIETQYKVLQEGFGSIRDIIINSNQFIYTKLFKKANYRFRYLNADNELISETPKLFIEAIVFFFIASFIFIFTRFENLNISDLTKFIGIVLLIQRILFPCFQQIFVSWSRISGEIDSIFDVFNLFNQEINNQLKFAEIPKMNFKKNIVFKNLYFKYQNLDQKYTLRNLNFDIKKGDRVGIIGETGSGKSTLVDLIIGLLIPNKGTIFIDDKNLHMHNIKKIPFLNIWRKSISHVPQSIFLTDDTIENNIKFSPSESPINQKRLIEVSKQAQLYSFIKSLPNGFNTAVGEKGINLSGGQKQRIGIARALYKGSNFLIFDEATNALDIDTENALIESIKNLSSEITVILISHRKSSLSFCNKILKIKNGNLEILLEEK